MSKKRVLFVVNHLTVGGVQKSLVSALNAVNYEENDITLYVRKNRTTLLPFINKNVNVIVNNDKKHYYRMPKALLLQFGVFIKTLFRSDSCRIEKKLNEYVTEQRMENERKSYFKDSIFDIAVSYSQGYTALFVSQYVNAKRKMVFYQGSADEVHEIHEEIFPRFDCIVVEHDDIKKLICSWYAGVEQKIVILENYTDYSLIRLLAQDGILEFNHSKPLLCTCARFEFVKGVDLAVEAARIMRRNGQDFIWYILGDGTEKNRIENLIRDYCLSDCIILTGMKTNPYPYMSAADIYVQPSREEALSIAMLESQVLCVPMVSTKTAGGLAMVEDGVNGVLAEINAQSLADSISSLIADENLCELIKGVLLGIDYSSKEIAYRRAWKGLLEG